MGILFQQFDYHTCTLCNNKIECVNLKNNFCENGYHSKNNIFLCKNCPNKNDFNWY